MSPLEQLPNTYRSFFGRFSSLTVAQKALIQPILDGCDVVLQAGTGMGKTEAVLAPATERLMTSLSPFTLIYIVPTRALALDMNRRIKPLYKQLGLKSGIRTGDGKTLKEGKPHLLILTPESLDVLLGSQNADNKYFLKHVRVLVIDEVHLFVHNERGQQLSYLRRRLERQAVGALQTLTLSATISDLEKIPPFFHLKNVFYYQQPARRSLEPCWVHLEDEQRELASFFDDLFFRWKCKKLLVFANSRKKCEQLAGLLNQEGIFSGHVLLHYSNFSTKERRFIESSFRDNKKSVCIATSTLEIGIDIGDVDGVVLIGPPPSTTAFLQRIGRGNRREQNLKFWGVCYGTEAESQLVRFLALFELAKENHVEKCSLADHCSVLFQQILSCLYAKKVISQNALSTLFEKEKLPSIMHEMVAQNWLKLMPRPELFCGGWRYQNALKQQKIWSNFPPSDEEYDVILEEEKMAVLPLSVVRQLRIGSLFQLTGKVLKVLRIEEKKASREVWVEQSNQPANTELCWCGFGALTSFEVAQKMGVILLGKAEPQGLLNRTGRLLEKGRNRLNRSVSSSSGIWIYRLENGAYRYETFLGSFGNFVVYHLIKTQLSSKIEDLSLSFDELGIESNEWIPLESLAFPYSVSLFQEWVFSHLALLRQAFSWNNWFHWLPEDLQKREIFSRLLDLRVLERFERYQKEWIPLTPPPYIRQDPQTQTERISILLKGEPWSLENEKQAWGKLSFPEVPSASQRVSDSLTATQIQAYVTQKLCPRLAQFQRLHFTVKSHPRFHASDLDTKSRRLEGISFKKQVIEELQKKHDVRWETTEFTLEKAIQEVIVSQKPLFLSRAKLKVEHSLSLKGSPDLIYLKQEGSHICVEVWDILNGYTFTYAQKWRSAFYAYLLEFFLMDKSFSLPLKLSELGGFIYRHVDKEKLFERAPFLLTHFKSWMPRLITQWKIDSMQDAYSYSMDSTCTSCRYFSYCYQETLFKHPAPIKNSTILSLDRESNDFPRNTKQWFFIGYDKENMRWQCWENQELIRDTLIYSREYANWNTFQEEVVKRLQNEWNRSVAQGKNPHFLVYEPAQWHCFQQAFHLTPLRSLWAMHACWTSIQSVLQTHFLWPIEGRLTGTQVARCLGLLSDPPRLLSLYHGESSLDISFDLYRHIWNWCLSQVSSRRIVICNDHKTSSVSLINGYLATQHRERECRTHEILEFQKSPLFTRVENFRAIGPMAFLGSVSDGQPHCYSFSIGAEAPISKFRVGDFLKLSPIESTHIQEGFSVILESYSPEKKILSVRPLSQKMPLSKRQLYALDECATDWNAQKIETVLNRLKDPKFRPELIQMLYGKEKRFPSTFARWIEQWSHSHAQETGLNPIQKEALRLPFLGNIGLIEGPPGTGKTHLLVWTLIALLAHAKCLNRSLKILVTAQTHQAIDQILRKIAKVFQSTNTESVPLWKCGRYDQAQFSHLDVHPLREPKFLTSDSSLILGATGFGIYQLLEGKNFPQLFDWVVFDESSQILPPYALLSLVFGKGNALFYGDTQQLPPVLMGNYDHISFPPRSILQDLISRCSSHNRLRLNETYRMNDAICQFASRNWYESQLYSAVSPKNQRLHLPRYPLFRDRLDEDLDPDKSMVVVQLDHEGCRQSSQEEAIWIAKAVKRLIEDYSISSDEIGIISPHRLQNNAISSALKEILPFSISYPQIDTVERMQGREFDIVIFSATVSDKETIHSPFLKDYRRFNVALTRSRKKFIFVASTLFFHSFPMTEKELSAHGPFEDFLLPTGSVLKS